MKEIDSTETLTILAFNSERQVSIHTPFTFRYYTPDTMEAKPDYDVIFKNHSFVGDKEYRRLHSYLGL